MILQAGQPFPLPCFAFSNFRKLEKLYESAVLQGTQICVPYINSFPTTSQIQFGRKIMHFNKGLQPLVKFAFHFKIIYICILRSVDFVLSRNNFRNDNYQLSIVHYQLISCSPRKRRTTTASTTPPPSPTQLAYIRKRRKGIRCRRQCRFIGLLKKHCRH